MIKIGKIVKDVFTVNGVYFENKPSQELNKLDLGITEYADDKTYKIYLGKKSDFSRAKLLNLSKLLVNIPRNIQVDISSFTSPNVKEADFIEAIIEAYEFKNGQIYNAKSNKKSEVCHLTLVNATIKDASKIFDRAMLIAQAQTYARNLQITPPNELNSIVFANKIKQDFAKFKNLKITILGKGELQKLEMNLLLSVNAGSNYDAQLVLIEYQGNPKSKDKLALVGKGITFDAGGYNVKVGPSMKGMKFDMSGAAVVTAAMQAISELKPQANVVALVPLTDNVISSQALTPDAVIKSMSGKTVEINNTDAEGRLILADALTYAVSKLEATKLVDIATLTGAIIAALGSTYSGAWANNELFWKKFTQAFTNAKELVWRMPLHEDYLKFMSGSKIADLKNTDLSGKAGSCSAAMFLNEFVAKQPFIHLDIAGTADIDETPYAPLVKTLVELSLLV